jgi:hypothetical protein
MAVVVIDRPLTVLHMVAMKKFSVVTVLVIDSIAVTLQVV